MLQSQRDAVAQDIHMLTTFASAQRFTDLNESSFSSSRADANFLTINEVRHPPSQATLETGFVHPLYDPFIKGAQRSSGVLDALATLFGSGEAAIAVSCAIDHQGQSVNLIVAANRDISNQKAREIVELWEGLKRISDAAMTINADSTPSEYHPESHKIFNSPSLDKFAKDDFCWLSAYLDAQDSFVLTALRQNKKKVVQRVQKYSAVLKNLDKFIHPNLRSFLGIESYLEIYEMLHTFIVQILKDLSFSENDYFNGIFFLLQKLQAARERVNMENLKFELLRNANDRSPAELRTIFKIKRSFSKPLMTINAITKFVNLARSPNTSKIFRNFEFRPVYLEYQKASILPENPAVWKERFYLMGIAGSRHDDDQNEQKNLSICIDQAIASRGTVAVHAEVKILSYMHKEGLMRKAMNNIGVSKLCCPGCFEFARAIQEPEIIIAGQHGKWYPFCFVAELEFPSDSQLEVIRQELLRTFKHDWGRYTLRKRTARFGNHSDSSAMSSRREELARRPNDPFTIEWIKNSLLGSSKGKEPAHKRKDL